MKAIEKAAKGDIRALESLLKAYRQAVPNAANEIDAGHDVADLTPADAAALDLMREMFADEAAAQPALREAPAANLVR